MPAFNSTGYACLLADWVVYSQRHLFPCREREGLLCYGPGEHGHWGTHTHQKAFSAFAVAAVNEEIDWKERGMHRETVLQQALGMLRYTLATHVTGDLPCADGGQWGHNWIYVLGVERMMHAVEALDRYLTELDRAALQRMLLSEADFLLKEYPVKAGLIENNKPESNIWNGATLYRAAAMYPDAPGARAYEDKALAFFANGISIESDEFSDERYSGRPLSELFVGANFFDSYGCNHHGYLNVGYMVICLSNIAMLYFSFKAMGKALPEIVMHHVHDLWRLIRACTFDDGRLLRIGGDSRARYCYCQDYALPMWAMIEDAYGEDCSQLKEGWLGILRAETRANGDGSFLSSRIGPFEERSPLYYTRLESDRANTISMLLHWNSLYPSRAEKPAATLTAWQDAYHGAAFDASGGRYASFVWHSCERPQALLLPKGESALAEWRNNLTGRIVGVGNRNFEMVEAHREIAFNGGFLTWGSTTACSDEFLAEGQGLERMADKRIAFAALPDGKTALSLQYAVAINRCYIASVRGIYWNVPNDLFNGRSRRFASAAGHHVLRGGEFAKKIEWLDLGHWVNVDDKLGIAATQPMTLYRAGRRQVDIVGRADSGTLYVEEICAPCQDARAWRERGDLLIDVGFAIALGGVEETAAIAQSLFTWDLGSALRAVGVMGADGIKYVLIANLSAQAVDASCPAAVRPLTGGDAAERVCLQAGEAGIFRL